eukprot:7172397-Prorocentrum_lima.AAC.1
MEVSPDTWLEGELRIHLHASFQKFHGAMYAKHASELAVCNAAPVTAVLLGDVGADCRSKSTGAAACHFYCSMEKIGQACCG